MNDQTTVTPRGAIDNYTEPVKPLPSLNAILWIAWFSFREMSRRKRLVSLGLINLLPVVMVLAIRIWLPEEGITAQAQMVALSTKAFIPFLIPVVAMAVGVSAIGEQVEEGTIVYLWTRPIKRRAIYLGRLLAAQLVSTGLLSLSLALCFLLYMVTFGIILLGSFAYSALFAAIGTFFKKPVLPAIMFTFGWERLVINIPARVQELSLRFHLQNMVDADGVEAPANLPGILNAILNNAIQRDPVPKLQSVVVLLVVMAIATAIGIYLLRMKQIEK